MPLIVPVGASNTSSKNIADMMTKCLSATVRERIMFELSAIAREIARKHLGGT